MATQLPTLPELPQLPTLGAVPVPELPELPALGTTQRDPDSFSSAVGRSVDQTQSAFGSFVQALGEATGSETMKSWGTDYYNKQMAEAEKYGVPSDPGFMGISNVEDFVNWGKNTLAQVGTSLAIAGTAGTAGFAATPGPVATKSVGAVVAGAMAMLPLNVGEVQQTIKQLDPDAEEPMAAFAAGTGMTALDMAGAGKLLKPVMSRIGKEAVVDAVAKQGMKKSAAREFVEGALVEGATESLQEAVSQSAAYAATDTEIDNEKFVEDLINAGAAGVFGGTVIGGTTGSMGALRDSLYKEGTAKEATPDEVSATPQTTTQKIWSNIAGRSTDVLEPLTAFSPTATALLNKLRPSKEKGVVSPDDFKTQTDLFAGKYSSRLTEIMRGMNSKEKAKFFDEYSRGIRDERHTQLADMLRDFRHEARKAGLNVGKIENFLPFVADMGKIRKSRAQFIEDLKPYLGEETESAVDSYLREQEQIETEGTAPPVDRWFTEEGDLRRFFTDKEGYLRDRVGGSKVPPRYGHLEQSRQFAKVPQSVLNNWSKNKPEENLMDYIQSGAHRINYASQFGTRGEKLNSMVAQILWEGAQAGRPVTQTEIDQIYGIADAMNNQHGKIKDKNIRTGLNVLKTATTVTALPLTLFSSLVEPLNIAIRSDMITFLRAFAPTVRSVSAAMVEGVRRDAPISEMSKTLQAANISLNTASNAAQQRLTDSLMGKTSAKVSEVFFKMNGLTYWTHLMRHYSANAAKIMIEDNVRTMQSAPKTSQAYVNAREMLAEVGIDGEQYSNAGVRDREAMRVRGIRRFVNDVVLEPNFADKPLWMSRQDMSILAQLKGYPTMFTNTVLPRLASKFDPRVGRQGVLSAVDGLFIVTSMLMISGLQDAIRMAIMGRDDDRSDAEYLYNILERSIMPAQPQYLVSALMAGRFGRDPSTTIFGPMVGFGNDVLRLGGAVASGEAEVEELEDFLIKNTPMRPFREWFK